HSETSPALRRRIREMRSFYGCVVALLSLAVVARSDSQAQPPVDPLFAWRYSLVALRKASRLVTAHKYLEAKSMLHELSHRLPEPYLNSAFAIREYLDFGLRPPPADPFG